MVVDALVYQPSIAHYQRFAATTVGRDKLLRTVQYFARFYAWYLLRTNATNVEIAPWTVLKAHFALIRRVLRFGKPVDHLRAAALASDAAKNSSAPVPAFLRYAVPARQLAYAAYLTCDALVLPDALGLRKSAATARLQRQAYQFWASGLIFSLAAQLYTLQNLRWREAAVDRKDGEGVVESKRINKEKFASQLQLICDLADLTVPASALGWVAFDDGFVGLAGTLSSLIGIYNQWRATA